MDNKSYNSNKYDDIINLPHPVSTTHPQMSMINRAAQFSPFAALPGHSDAIKETARVTDKKRELDENEKFIINERLLMLSEILGTKPMVSITYFKQDNKKSGGKYLTVIGCIKKIDTYENCIKMENGTIIVFEDIAGIESDVFKL